MDKEYPGVKATVFESPEYQEIIKREEVIGADNIFTEFMELPTLTNPQLMWMLKYMLSHYGGKDKTLLKAPAEKIFDNMSQVLRIAYLLIDSQNPALDENLRLYVTTKLKQATWGLDEKTRYYLKKVNTQ